MKAEFSHSHIIQNSFLLGHLTIGPKVNRIFLSIFKISLMPFYHKLAYDQKDNKFLDDDQEIV
jgi:hypothetical protein